MTTPHTDDSRIEDRRTTHPLLADWRWAFRGRRRVVRRETDDGRVHLDHVPPRVVAATFIVMLLSAFDAYFTLVLIRAGAVSEANPVMRFFMDLDVQMFINVKIAFTAAALVFLGFCAELHVFSKVRVEGILYCVLGAYAMLMVYHVSLLAKAGLF